MYTGEDFQIDVRYAQFMASFMITLMFSSGIPGLYLIMFIQLIIIYWVDKFTCKLYIFILLLSFKNLQDTATLRHRYVADGKAHNAVCDPRACYHVLLHLLEHGHLFR